MCVGSGEIAKSPISIVTSTWRAVCASSSRHSLCRLLSRTFFLAPPPSPLFPVSILFLRNYMHVTLNMADTTADTRARTAGVGRTHNLVDVLNQHCPRPQRPSPCRTFSPRCSCYCSCVGQPRRRCSQQQQQKRRKNRPAASHPLATTQPPCHLQPRPRSGHFGQEACRASHLSRRPKQRGASLPRAAAKQPLHSRTPDPHRSVGLKIPEVEAAAPVDAETSPGACASERISKTDPERS